MMIIAPASKHYVSGSSSRGLLRDCENRWIVCSSNVDFILLWLQDCSKVLDSRVKGSECWPIRHHVLCYKCYRRRQSESESESEE